MPRLLSPREAEAHELALAKITVDRHDAQEDAAYYARREAEEQRYLDESGGT